MPRLNAAPRLPLRPLAAAFALALALDHGAVASMPATPRSPQAIVVQNCDDSGAGSLRDAVNNAVDGDTIDLTQLQCSTVSLSTGAILIGVTDLTLHGPGGHRLTLMHSGGYGDILYDLGGGTLTVDGIDLTLGNKYRSDNDARGGCLYTNGNLVLNDSRVSSCSVRANTYAASGGAIFAYGTAKITNSEIYGAGLTTSGAARGGCVFAHGGVTLLYSRVSACRNATTTHGYGGGVYSGGDLVMKYSTIENSENDDATYGTGGGAFVLGDSTVFWSTISGNSATVGGGIALENDNGGHSATIAESTIYGNTANAAGGISAAVPLDLENSTVSSNTVTTPNKVPIDYSFSGGLAVRASPVTITSSILANNIAIRNGVGEPADIGGDIPIPVGGSANLIMSSAQPIPPDTIADDPQLGPLEYNGGLTRTQLLMPGSPAIDHGDPGTWDTDQRGAGFARIGNGHADIGAFEVDPDQIFRNGFD